MVRLREKRTALLLYAVLLVLPTLVLGGLQWRQLIRDQEDELAAVPDRARNAAERLVGGMRARLDALLAPENARPFYDYGEFYAQESALGDGLVMVPTPLDRDLPPRGVLAWFNFEPFYAANAWERDEDSGLDLFFGPEAPGPEPGPGAEELWDAATEYMLRSLDEGSLVRAARMGTLRPPIDYPLAVLAVNRGDVDELGCLADCLEALEPYPLPVRLTNLRFQLYVGDDGVPRVVATRRAFFLSDLPPLPESAACVREPLELGFGLLQGFFLDPGWLFVDLPREVAAQVLSGSERLVLPRIGEEPDREGAAVIELDLVDALDLSVPETGDHNFARVAIAVDQAPLLTRHRSQTLRFAAVGAMLLLSLGTGMVLLLRAVTREMEHAEQTENFVASVTHELRTPLSAIRLHGEMLLDGWVSEPAKQEEYYRRILRETERLSRLVERVLEQARLSRKSPDPEPGDLGPIVERVGRDLARNTGQGTGDLVVEIEPGLPQVILTREGIAGILVNLVENARKYAPVDTTRSGFEPICVRARVLGDRVVLEVSDRGPGIPAEERGKVFDAFYRIGNEATRTSTGTGLGLHLVHLHATGLGARVEVLDNEGGGALFRVTLRSAPKRRADSA